MNLFFSCNRCLGKLVGSMLRVIAKFAQQYGRRRGIEKKRKHEYPGSIYGKQSETIHFCEGL